MPAPTRRTRRPALPHLAAAAVVAAAAMAGCSPALDWRDLQPEDSGARVQFPCKPVSTARDVPLAGTTLRLTLHACTAGDDATYALAVADTADPARVGDVLQALLDSAAGNIGGTPAPLPLAVRGATPNPAARRVALAGTRSDGEPVQAQVAVFAKGTRVYQATVLGRRVDAEAADTFFGALQTQ